MCSMTAQQQDLQENNTKQEEIEPGTDTMTITMAPRATDKVIMAYIEPTTANQAIYDDFFTAVYVKDQVPSA